MILKNKKLLIITSLLTLFPIIPGLLLWDRFPGLITTHWGFDGQADGWSSVSFAVFGMPLILLATHWICIGATALDPGNKNRNRKPLTMVLWIIPLLSNLSSGLMYALALGADISVSAVMVGAMGLLFAAIGNYMPKMKMNATMGIKVPWTYTSEENWNATHRFAGKLWVVGGIVMLLGIFLPEGAAVALMVIDMVLLCAAPILYSRRFWKRQKTEGTALKPMPKLVGSNSKLAALLLCLLILFLLLVLFSGNLHPVYSETGFTIEASFYDDLTVAYSAIDSIEYRDGNVPGSRIFGFGSLRLLLGTFENAEFGTYTRYTYYDPDACIVLTCGENTLVLSGRDASETKAIYKYLQNKIK